MSPSRLQRLVLSAYPEQFRQHYGEEFATVVADCGAGWRVTVDLALGAVKAHLVGDTSLAEPGRGKQRLETTTATVFALWAWGAAAMSLFAWAVDAGPVPGLKAWGRVAYAAGNVVLSLAAVGVFAICVVYWLLVMVPAIRSRDWATVRPAALAPAVVVLWLGGTGSLAFATNHIRPGNYRHITAQGPHTAAGWALLVLYGLFTAACMIVCTVSARRALRRAELPSPLLRLSSVAAIATAGALAATTACAAVCAARVLMVGGISALGELGTIGPVCFLLVASLAASTSSLRGLRAVRFGSAA